MLLQIERVRTRLFQDYLLLGRQEQQMLKVKKEQITPGLVGIQRIIQLEYGRDIKKMTVSLVTHKYHYICLKKQ